MYVFPCSPNALLPSLPVGLIDDPDNIIMCDVAVIIEHGVHDLVHELAQWLMGSAGYDYADSQRRVSQYPMVYRGNVDAFLALVADLTTLARSLADSRLGSPADSRTDSPEADSTSALEADSTSAPEADSTSAPEADSTSAPEADSTSAPEALDLRMA